MFIGVNQPTTNLTTITPPRLVILVLYRSESHILSVVQIMAPGRAQQPGPDSLGIIEALTNQALITSRAPRSLRSADGRSPSFYVNFVGGFSISKYPRN
jgi:hypothetical protein